MRLGRHSTPYHLIYQDTERRVRQDLLVGSGIISPELDLWRLRHTSTYQSTIGEQGRDEGGGIWKDFYDDRRA